MKSLVFLTMTIFSISAMADQFKTVRVSGNVNRYSYDYSYPSFNSQSVPGYQKINASIEKIMSEDDGCAGGPERSEEPDYDYSATARVVALNPDYVGIGIVTSSYCGGAHPNYYVYNLTYNSQTGELADIPAEFGFTKEDYDVNEKIQQKVARVLANHIPKDSACFENRSDKSQVIEELMTMWPVVQGLAKNKTVVLGISPAHAIYACQFDVRVPYAEVKDLIRPGSFLHSWLK